MATDWKSFDAMAELLLKSLAPECQCPIYFFDVANVVGDADVYYTALTFADADLFARPFVSEWRGRGIGIGVSRGYLESTSPADCVFDRFFSLMTHEFAHAIREHQFAQVHRPEPATDLTARREHLRIEAEEQRPPTEEQKRYAQIAHDAVWCRVVCHLVKRAHAGGLALSWHDVKSCELPLHMSSLAYRLGDECERMNAATFQEIMDAPMPTEFAAAFPAIERNELPRLAKAAAEKN